MRRELRSPIGRITAMTCRLRSTLLFVLACGLVSTAAQAQAVSQAPVVVTQGEATVKRPADQAWISVSTETREVKSDDARRKGAEAMTAVQNAIKGARIPADAVRTVGYSLSPDMEWNNGRGTVRGYIVRNTIDVRIDAIERMGDVIDAVNATRGTTLSIAGPRFGLKDQASVENEALKLAVAAALTRAQAMAAGAQRAVGAIVRIEEQNAGLARPEPVLMRSAMAVAAPVETPISPGDIEVRVQVTVTVELR
jgi:uncharacterized protein